MTYRMLDAQLNRTHYLASLNFFIGDLPAFSNAPMANLTLLVPFVPIPRLAVLINLEQQYFKTYYKQLDKNIYLHLNLKIVYLDLRI